VFDCLKKTRFGGFFLAGDLDSWTQHHHGGLGLRQAGVLLPGAERLSMLISDTAGAV